MAEFTPVNSIEIVLRRIINNKNTPVWEFFTPLAAATLWLIVRNDPKLLSKGRTSGGKNPELLTFRGPEGSYIGIYTSPARVEEAMKRWDISPKQFTSITLQGYELLKFVQGVETDLCINLGVDGCHYMLDPDLVEILLERPRPASDADSLRHVSFDLDIDPARHFGPLRDFLRAQPHVRAAWLVGSEPDDPLPENISSYDFMLLMDDPEDDSLLDQVDTMLKALSPITIECRPGIMASDDHSLRHLAAEHPPFYRRADFLKAVQALRVGTPKRGQP